LNQAGRRVGSGAIDRNGRKIGGFGGIVFGYSGGYKVELALSFLHDAPSYPVKIVVDGAVVDTVEQRGRFMNYDLAKQFGGALQRLQAGGGESRPVPRSLKAVLVAEGQDVVLLDAELSETERALQRLSMVVEAIKARLASGRSPTMPTKPLHQGSGDQPRLPPQGDKARQAESGDRRMAARPDADDKRKAPAAPPFPAPKSADECRAIPDAVAARLKRLRGSGIPHGFYYIDQMYLFGSEAILAACAEGKFDQAAVLATEVLGRLREVRQQERFYQASVKFSHQQSGRTVPLPKTQDECRKTWGRILSIMPLDDVDGEENFGYIRTLCDRRDYARAREEMSKYIDREVRAEIERVRTARPGGPFGSGRSSR
jgi:hypothetical protein